MHDRRINGEPHVFGNFGALYMNAMTWWDHRTQSVWSQPWGAAIEGPLKGTRLTLIPAEVVPWATWRSEHPQTTVITDERPLLPRRYGPALPHGNFVIGVAVNEDSAAFHFASTLEARVVNDEVGGLPIAVFAHPNTLGIDVYLRTPSRPAGTGDDPPMALTFEVAEDGTVTDAETRSHWDLKRGVAVEGRYEGASLRQLPYITSFDWAWRDFYPNSRFWGKPPE